MLLTNFFSKNMNGNDSLGEEEREDNSPTTSTPLWHVLFRTSGEGKGREERGKS